jgi:hypothetical protein
VMTSGMIMAEACAERDYMRQEVRERQ